MAPQESDAIDENENENAEQGKFNHGGVEDAEGGLGRPRTFPCERSCFQGDHEHAADRGNQTYDQEGSVTSIICERMEMRTV